jgi:hypothetical protein
MSAETTERRCTSTLSKKRYAALEERWRELNGEEKLSESQVEGVLRALREVMRFDPEGNGYTPEVGRRLKEYRRKMAAELGVSTYVLRQKGVKGARRDAEEAKSALRQNLEGASELA